MSRPGTSVVVSDAIPPISAPTDTGVAFFIGEAQRGPVDVPAQVRSLDSFTQRFGERINPPHLHDGVEAAFRDGLGRAYVLRLADDEATAASNTAGAFSVGAVDVGEWGDQIELELAATARLAELERPRRRLALVMAGGSPRASRAGTREDAEEDGNGNGEEGNGEEGNGNGNGDGDGNGDGGPLAAVVRYRESVVERSLATLQTVGDLVAWALGSSYVRVTTEDETAELQAGSWTLSGGADGTLPVNDPYALLDAALRIPEALGPGQLLAPGKIAATQHEALLKGCEQGNRVAYLDADPNADEAALVAHVRALRQLGEDRFGGLFAPRAIVPGRAPGTLRTIAWSGVQVGLTARLDVLGNPNRAPAGSFGISRWAVGLEREYTDEERERLMYAGVNTARVVYGTVRGYGFRTLVDETGPRRAWLQLSNSRLAMAIKARADEVAERYTFENIDGRGLTLARFGGELAAICMDYWPEGLYGEAPEEAFRVETGDAVNTPETIANGEIRAVILLRMAPFGEWVEVRVVKQPITEALA